MPPGRGIPPECCNESLPVLRFKLDVRHRRPLQTSALLVTGKRGTECLSRLDVKLYAGARQLAAFAGPAPRLHESCSSVRRRARLSKTWAPRLRKALYFPAITALRCSPFFQQWA